MTKISDATFKGRSGVEYTFEVYDSQTSFNEGSAIYIFTLRTVTGTKGEHRLLYIGESAQLGTRIASHEKWSCVTKHGCNCICVLIVSNDERRKAIEQDLRSGNQTPCNDQ